MKRLLKLAGAFLMGTALSRLAVFLLLPLYTSELTPEEFGFFDLAQTAATLVVAFLYADVWHAAMRFMRQDGGSDKQTYFTAALVCFLASSGIYLLVAIGVGLTARPPMLLWIAALGLTSAFKEFWGFAARGDGNNRQFIVSGVVSTLVTVATNIALLVGMGWGIEALFAATIIGYVVQVLWLEGTCRLRRLIQFRGFPRESVGIVARFIAPLGFSALAYWIIVGYGRIAVSQELGLSDNGLFAIGARFSGVVAILAGVVTLAWQDIAFSADRSDAQGFYSRWVRVAAAGYGAAIVIAVPGSAVLFDLVVNDAYGDAVEVLPWFMLSAGLIAFSTFLGNAFVALHRTGWQMFTLVVPAVVVLAGSNLAVRGHGLNAAAVVGSAACLIAIALRAGLLKRFTGMALYPVELGVVVILAIAVIWSFYRLDGWAWFVAQAACAVLAAANFFLVIVAVRRERIG